MRLMALGAIFVLMMGGSFYLFGVAFPKMRRRQELSNRIGRVASASGSAQPAQRGGFARLIKPVGEFLIPKAESERSIVRNQLQAAGFRKGPVFTIFFGLKAVSALGALGIYALVHLFFEPKFASPFLLFALAILFGFYLPNRVLGFIVRRRHDEIFMKLPDVMDLMIVCVEAGLGLDATLKKLSIELDDMSPMLASEFRTLSFELQAGVPRSQALANLGDRNGEESLKNLARVLVQADRFGTGIGQSLRTYIEMMTSKRIQLAEEATGRAAVKLSFPLVGCILPALWIVLMGPAILRLMDTLRGAAQ